MADKADKLWNKKNWNIRLVTPAATASWCHLDKTEVIDGDETNKYSITLVLPAAAPETLQFVNKYLEIKSQCQQLVDKDFGNEGYKMGEDGSYEFKFKSKRKPVVVDSKKNLVTERVMGGAKVKCIVKPWFYTGLGGGVSLQLVSVQVLEMSDGDAAASDMFDEEDGFESSGNQPSDGHYDTDDTDDTSDFD